MTRMQDMFHVYFPDCRFHVHYCRPSSQTDTACVSCVRASQFVAFFFLSGGQLDTCETMRRACALVAPMLQHSAAGGPRNRPSHRKTQTVRQAMQSMCPQTVKHVDNDCIPRFKTWTFATALSKILQFAARSLASAGR